MKHRLVSVFILAFLSLSLRRPYSIGMLSDDFGIVTREDVEEINFGIYKKMNWMPAEADYNGPPVWQCLQPDEVSIGCDSSDLDASDQPTAAPDFTIREGHWTHRLYTRRFFGLETCEEWVREWRAVVENEPVVCILGDPSFASEEEVRTPSDPRTYWILHRIKTYHGQWSYFLRGGDSRLYSGPKTRGYVVPPSDEQSFSLGQ